MQKQTQRYKAFSKIFQQSLISQKLNRLIKEISLTRRNLIFYQMIQIMQMTPTLTAFNNERLNRTILSNFIIK